MARDRIHSLAFKKQVVQEYAAGATLNGLAREHDLSRNLIRIWIAKCERGELDPDVKVATLLGDYEAKIATLERMVGRQALEIEFLKGALQQGRLPRSAPMSVPSSDNDRGSGAPKARQVTHGLLLVARRGRPAMTASAQSAGTVAEGSCEF